MRHVRRGSEPSPSALAANDRNGENELARARRHVSDPNAKGSYGFAVYKHVEVKQRLDALFHGKCAYCETYYSASAPVDIEHFRPKGAVSEDPSHPGYWWIAMAWENLLPSCIDCNRKRKQSHIIDSASLEALNAGGRRTRNSPVLSGKKDSFPLAPGAARLQPELTTYLAEQALLLNPCDDQPNEHLEYIVEGRPSISLMLPRGIPDPSLRGATSIQIYGLNRLGLVQERTRLLRRLEFLGDLVLELGEMIDALDTQEIKAAIMGTPAGTVAKRMTLLLDRALAEMRSLREPDQPYSAMVTAWIEVFEARIDVKP